MKHETPIKPITLRLKIQIRFWDGVMEEISTVIDLIRKYCFTFHVTSTYWKQARYALIGVISTAFHLVLQRTLNWKKKQSTVFLSGHGEIYFRLKTKELFQFELIRKYNEYPTGYLLIRKSIRRSAGRKVIQNLRWTESRLLDQGLYSLIWSYLLQIFRPTYRPISLRTWSASGLWRRGVV